VVGIHETPPGEGKETPTMNIEQHVRAARQIWHRVDAEGRKATRAELKTVERHLDAIDLLKSEGWKQANAGAPYAVAGDGSGRAIGPGWNVLAQSIDLKAGKLKTKTSLAGLMRGKDLTGPGALDFPPLRAPSVATGVDERYLYPNLATQSLGPELSVQEFRQVGSAAVTGDVERSPVDTSTKAEVDVELELASEEVRQIATTISAVPNAVLEADVTLRAFLQQQMRVKLDAAIDAHCISQIDAENTLGGGAGSNLIEQIRNGVSAMASAGTRPTIVALSPEDSVELDLFTVGAADNEYLFAVRDSGASSPLFGLRVVECSSVTDPVLLDPLALGLLYVGQATFQVDPYSGFKENLSTVRLEGNILYHVRNPDGAYIIGGS
jgi:hypothetical protein